MQIPVLSIAEHACSQAGGVELAAVGAPGGPAAVDSGAGLGPAPATEGPCCEAALVMYSIGAVSDAGKDAKAAEVATDKWKLVEEQGLEVSFDGQEFSRDVPVKVLVERKLAGIHLFLSRFLSLVLVH